MVEAAARKELSKGTLPEGAANERDASRKVREMFTQIAPRYDLLNHLLSLQMDRMWRARTAKILRPILERADAKILDLCCGTGDLAFALQRNSRGRVWGADFAHTMLVRAKEKAGKGRTAKEKPAPLKAKGAAPGRREKKTLEAREEKDPPPKTEGGAPSVVEKVSSDGREIPFVESDALRLPFADGAFDLVTAAFGFRNLANYEAGLTEIRRVLRPGGTIAILEFTEPKPGWFGDLYRWYFRAVLPRLGGLISGDRASYSYLPKSVARFLQPGEFTELIAKSGFEDVAARVWTGGTVALHTGVKQS
jgi:demethylmenaquinone methyltransferase/2-methoxy-6-polyprenyl-1,4-benzoquinol methylase